MSRTRESGGYLGGIGVMLGEATACPMCGETHPETPFGIRHGEPRECPKVILGSFPVIDHLEEEEQDFVPIPHSSLARRIREFETPIQVSLTSPPPRRPDEVDSRPRGLGVPWLRPPDLGEVL